MSEVKTIDRKRSFKEVTDSLHIMMVERKDNLTISDTDFLRAVLLSHSEDQLQKIITQVESTNEDTKICNLLNSLIEEFRKIISLFS